MFTLKYGAQAQIISRIYMAFILNLGKILFATQNKKLTIFHYRLNGFQLRNIFFIKIIFKNIRV